MAASQSLSGGWTQSETAHRPSAFPFLVNAQGIILLNPVSVADDVTSENLHKIMWLLMMLIGAINKAGCYESFGSELYIVIGWYKHLQRFIDRYSTMYYYVCRTRTTIMRYANPTY